MAGKLEPLPGTGDIWEPEVSEWVLLENAARDIFPLYGYGELRTPIFEKTDLFVRGIGGETDVVQKEMYTFEDRGGRSLTLRPEGTAGVMRAIANNGLAEDEEKRVFYMGPMFRGERPAAGRRRQFHQIGVEAAGRCNPAVDAECIAMLMHFLEQIGISGGRLMLNSRGLPEDHRAVTAAMVSHFQPCIDAMCDDCGRRLVTNVWRILDCKEGRCQEYIASAPGIVELLSPASQAFFSQVRRNLDSLGVAYELEHRLVRGLDYYAHTVFEVVHDGLGAQNAVAGGGRYNITVPGYSKTVEGVGFAVGMERLLMVRESLGVKTAGGTQKTIYIISLGDACIPEAMKLGQILRHAGIRSLISPEARSMKAQMRAANKAGSDLVLIFGENELLTGTVTCKNMQSSEQTQRPSSEVVEWVRNNSEHL